jgi:hypothetical protein
MIFLSNKCHRRRLLKSQGFSKMSKIPERENVCVCVRKRERGKDRMKMTERERKIVKRE